MFPTTLEGIVVVVGIIALSAYTFVRSRALRAETVKLSTDLTALEAQTIPHLTDQNVVQQLEKFGLAGATMLAAWHHLRRIRKLPSIDTQMALNAVPLLQERVLARLRQRPNQLMLLGLLGTVLGLSITIGSFAPQLEQSLELLSSGQSPEELNNSLGELLRQMKVAFVCTLWGVASSLIVTRWAVIPVAEQRDHTQQQLEQLVIFQMLPVAWKDTVQREEAMLAAFAANRDSLERIHTTMAQQLQTFQQQTDRAAKVFENAGLHLETVGLKAADAAVEVSRTSSTAASVLQQVTETLQRNEAELSKTTSALDTNVSTLQLQQAAYKHMNDQVLQAASGHARDLDRLVQNFADIVSHLLDGLQANVDGFETARAELIGHTTLVLDEQRRGGGEFTQVIATLFSQVERAFQNHQAAAQSVSAELKHVTGALQPLEELTQRLDPRLLPTERWHQFQQSLDHLTSHWDVWQHTFTQRMDTLLDSNGTAIIAEARQMTQVMGQQLSATGSKVTEEIGQALSHWNLAYDKLALYTTGTLQGQMSVAEQLQKQHDDLRRELHQVTRSLEAIAEHLKGLKAPEMPGRPPEAKEGRHLREGQPYGYNGDEISSRRISLRKNPNGSQQ
ncbi:hypothetical protein QR90_08530 [Deinococcus radiopugnans]|uniref:Uncharacterized protein n=1 Tax=Deinococcus radiopugnans TaxID=57497 RepID=A0A0A7KKP9_9DEIO|nr:hypothetical protein QR90_08530 [Deinococcus radiopugnans]